MAHVLMTALVAATLLLPFGIGPNATAAGGGDCDTGADIDEVNATWTPPFTCSGSVDGSGEGFGADPEDWYRFRIDSRVRVVVEMQHTPHTAVTLCLFDAAGIAQRCQMTDLDGRGRVGWVADNVGDWRLKIRAGLWETGYTFRVRLEDAPPPPAPQDDCNTGADADDPFIGEGHAPMPLDGIPRDCSGELHVVDDIDGYGMDQMDVFALPLHAGERVRLKFTMPTYAQACIEYVGCTPLTTPDEPVAFLNATIPRNGAPASLWITYDWCPCHPRPVSAAWRIETEVLPPIMQLQEHTGQLTFGAPFPHEDFAVPPGEGGIESVEHVWIPLERVGGDGTSAVLEWSSLAPADLDVLFFNEAPRALGFGIGIDSRERGECATLSVERETCAVPDGAAWALLRLRAGVMVDYRFAYEYWV